MAGVTGTEVLYKRESKLGLTTLTFRKRRYLFPSVAHQGEHILSASTGDLESRGKCVMLDVGLFCPHCAGAITATLSGSHSKLVVSKVKGREHKCIEAGDSRPQTQPRPVSQVCSGQEQRCESVDRGKTKIKMPAGLAEETRLEIGFGSLDRHRQRCHSPDKHRRLDKLSSSDYESLDRDIHMDTWSSYDTNTGTFDSVTRSGSLTAPSRTDDAYCSMTSSQHSTTQDSLQKMSSLSPKYSSLPRDVKLPPSAQAVSEEKLILDTMHVETSDKNDSALVDELLSDDVIDEEYLNLMNASAVKEVNGIGQVTDSDKSLESHEMIHLPSDEGKNEDSCSQRSTSPETFVDDVLENIESEIYPGDATLPRVFALHREGSSSKRSSKKKQKLQSQATRHRTENGEDLSKRNTSSLKRKELHELIKAFCKASPKSKFTAQDDADFSHETVFEEVVEALTDLEGGFTTDWTSDYDSDNKCGSPSSTGSERAKFLLGDEREGSYREIADGYKIRNKTATSSCECIPDDRSRDLDSSTERISSSVATPSELSAGSAEGYGSSSECSFSGQAESSQHETRLFEELIQNTKSLTEDLLVMREDYDTPGTGVSQEADDQIHIIPPDKRNSPVTDQLNEEDVFMVGDQSTIRQNITPNKPSTNKSSVHVDVVRNIGPIPKIVEPDEHFEDVDAQSHTRMAIRLTTKSENSDDDDDDDDDVLDDGDDLDISLENLLVSNAIHCSTSDLDEPYSAELRYVSGLESGEDSHRGEEQSSSDTHPGNTLTEVDEFVPETDEPRREVLQQTFDDVVCTSSPSDTCKQSHVTGAGLDGSDEQAATLVDQSKVVTKDKAAIAETITDGGNTSLVSKDLMKYVQSQTCKTYQSKEHNTRLDTCLDDTCQTCDFQPKAPNEFVKKEEVITQEMTLVFVWPKKMKMNIGKELAPKVSTSKPKEPYRSVHLRRVMRVSDFDVDVVEGPVIETVEYRKDGAMRKSIVQRPAESDENENTQKSENDESVSDLERTEQSKEAKERLASSKQREESLVHPQDGSPPCDEDQYEKPNKPDDGEPESLRKQPDDSLAELERSHYDMVSESFVMPSIDMTTSQRSEELFDLSSATSMEFLMETENDLEHFYSDHQKTVDAIYEHAERDSLCEEHGDVGVADLEGLPELTQSDSNLKNEGPTSTRTELEIMKEDLQPRESGSIPGKEAKVRLIDQTERNVYFVSVGKYFADRSDGAADVVDGGRTVEDQSEEGDRKESSCPRCENIYVIEEGKTFLNASKDGDVRASGDSERRRHPVPCERCIRLEREIRIKLAELSKLIEEIGRRRKLRHRESLEDLDTLSEETAENIRILERSIAMLNDVNEEQAADDVVASRVVDDDVTLSEDGRVPRDAITSQPRRTRHKAPVSYSTKVIKKRKPKHVIKLREIFRESLPADGTSQTNNSGQLSDFNSSNRDACLLSRDSRLATAEMNYDAAQASGDPTTAHVRSTSARQDNWRTDSFGNEKLSSAMAPREDQFQNKLETFAENLAKYIIFRAKLFIVLENPATRIPYLKNELVAPTGNDSERADDICGGTSPEGRDIGSGDCRVRTADNGNASGVGVFTNTASGTDTTSAAVSTSASGTDDRIAPDIRARVKQVAQIQARIEFSMRRIREKLSALRALESVRGQTLNADPDVACLSSVAPSGADPGHVCTERSLSPERVSPLSSCDCVLDNALDFDVSVNVLRPAMESSAPEIKETIDGLTDAGTSVNRCDPDTTDVMPSFKESDENVTDSSTTSAKTSDRNVTTCAAPPGAARDRRMEPVAPSVGDGSVTYVDARMLESAEKLRRVIKALSLDASDTTNCAGTDDVDADVKTASTDDEAGSADVSVGGSVVKCSADMRSTTVTRDLTETNDEENNAHQVAKSETETVEGGNFPFLVSDEQNCRDNYIRCKYNRCVDSRCHQANCECVLERNRQTDQMVGEERTTNCELIEEPEMNDEQKSSEEVESLRRSGTKEELTARHLGAHSATEADDSKEMEQTEADDTEDMKQVEADDAERKKQVGADEAEMNQTEADDISRLKQIGADDGEKMKQILEFLDVYKHERTPDNVDDVVSVTSSDVSDTSVNTIIHVPGPRRDRVGGRCSAGERNRAGVLVSEGEQTFATSQAGKPRQSTGMSSSESLTNLPADAEARRGESARGTPTGSDRRSRDMLHVIRGRPITVLVRSCRHGKCQQPNVRCIPLTSCRDSRLYAAGQRTEVLTSRKRAAGDAYESRDHQKPRQPTHDSFRGGDPGSLVRTSFLATNSRNRNGSMDHESLIKGAVSSVNVLDGEASASRLRWLGLAESCKHGQTISGYATTLSEGPDLPGLHRCQSCHDVGRDDSRMSFERRSSCSDSALLSGGHVTRKQRLSAVGSCVRCPVSAGHGQAISAEAVSGSSGTSGHLGAGSDRLSAEFRRSVPCSCLLSERRWSEADLDVVRRSLEPESVPDRRTVDAEVKDESCQPDAQQQQQHQLKADFSTYVSLYAPYFECRRSRLAYRRSQIRITSDPRVTCNSASTDRRRSVSLSPARSRQRSRSRRRAKSKKYLI